MRGQSISNGQSGRAIREKDYFRAHCRGFTVKTEEVDSAHRESREPVIVFEQGKNRTKVLF